MKKLIVALLMAIVVTACGNMKVYNNALKQIELGMTRSEVVGLMGDKFNTTGTKVMDGKTYESLEYVDKYKNHFFFEFADNSLYKWYKEKEN